MECILLSVDPSTLRGVLDAFVHLIQGLHLSVSPKKGLVLVLMNKISLETGSTAAGEIYGLRKIRLSETRHVKTKKDLSS